MLGAVIFLRLLPLSFRLIGNILATENQQARIIGVIEVKNGVYSYET